MTASKTVLNFNHVNLLVRKKGISMKAISELRNGERFYSEEPVLVEDNRTGYRYEGTMFNYSKSGMYLETDYAPRPSRIIKIDINALPNFPSPRGYFAEVRWRQPLSGKGSAYSFGMGVKYY